MSSSAIETALGQAYTEYTERNPRSLARHEAATEVMPGGNTRTVLYTAPFPLGIARAEGCYLRDLDGHRYVDFLGEYTAGIYGHSHPVIRAALDRALDDGINFGGHNVMEVRLAQAVCQRFPSIELVRFTNSGTAALIEQHSADLAAIILEPMLGGGGCIPADREFLAMLRAETTRTGSILIFDEVMTSRLSPGGLQAVHGILPDMTTLGKYIGGGMSFGAFGGRADLMAQFDPSRPDGLPHAGTFNNNVLTMSAGLAGIMEVYTPAAAIALNARGDALRARLNDLCRRHEVPMQFTGIGSMMNVHMTDAPVRTPGDAAKGDQQLRELFFFDLLNAGIWVARRGMINLSLPIGDNECDTLVNAVDSFVRERLPLLEGALTGG